MSLNVFVFDIETIPDVKSGRRLYELSNLSDQEVVEAMQAFRRQETQGASDFIRHYLQQIVCISGVLRHRDQFKVWSLGEANSLESEIIERFYAGLEKLSPTLVSWNGAGFDLPVLHYRALLHGISAARYWDQGEIDRDYKWNNYLARYHQRHIDLMDVLAAYQSKCFAPLDDLAVMLGLPGKMGMSGAKVWEAYRDGEIESIRNYCETDVLNTYLVYLRFELMRGHLDHKNYEKECDLVKEHLSLSGKPHLLEFLKAWELNSEKVNG